MGAVELLKSNRFWVRSIIRDLDLSKADQSTMNDCLQRSLDVWVGMYDDEIYCIWGVIPPTILSTRAYLWLYVDQEKVSERQFIFIRKSQIAVKKLLEDFDVLYGITDAGSEKTVRWLKWLGAEFERGWSGQLEFKIRRK